MQGAEQMDRDRIQRRDFSSARRGYDPREVDEHLRLVADEVEGMRGAGRSSEGLAGMAADQIKGIVDAAERSASEIRQRAEADAAEQVDRVLHATERLLERTDGAEAALDRLVETLRAEAGSLLSELRGSVKSVRGELERIREALPELRVAPGASGPMAQSAVAAGAAVSPQADVVGEEDERLPAEGPPGEPPVEPGEPAAMRAGDEGEAPAADEVAAADPLAGEAAADEPADVEEGEAGAPALEPEEAAAEEAAGSAGNGERRAIAGSEGARLIALNMALNGTPREETARYLSENFDIEDQEAVLEDVYSRVGE